LASVERDAMRSAVGAMRQPDAGGCFCGTLLTMIDHVTGSVMGDRQASGDSHVGRSLARAVL
jgi:hypothetical protein